MSVGRYAWDLRRRVLGTERVVTGDRVAALGRSELLGLRSRTRIRALHLREIALGPPRAAVIAVGDAQVELGGSTDFAIDWKAFVEIVVDDEYEAPYSGAHVLDIGAHKGYFGAYALARGASFVLSFEPAAHNYGALERAAQPLGERWVARNAAVGSTKGTGTLLLDTTSWAHSLVHVERPAGEQTVELVTLEHALSELPRGGSLTIVKIDAEGSECAILSRPEALRHVDLLLVEWHPKIAPCTAADLVRAADAAGLTSVNEGGGLLRFARS